ncbi:hypothetical protein LPJ61_001115 [Coemansia biformis]|uniref:Uncharacterized protein n=1 Tax=Coemansia biformis TaxID=1286918 RepID=A0A9W8CXL0_9FUNG|nr:hypothetical protein LPJ61_001115 [Coemansia biformis]
MIFVRQERLLRISKDTAIAVHIYLQEHNVAWFADSLLQEVLLAVKPRLQDKIAACRKGTLAASVFANRAFQVAYYVDKIDHAPQVLLQEQAVKSEDMDGSGGDSSSGALGASQFAYVALRASKLVLVLVPEPFDANNTVALPEVLAVDLE